MISIILLAGLLAGLETNAPVMNHYGSLLRGLDVLVLAAFLTEIILNLAVHGRQPWRYFQDGWNVFDFIIVAVCFCRSIHSLRRSFGWRACACSAW